MSAKTVFSCDLCEKHHISNSLPEGWMTLSAFISTGPGMQWPSHGMDICPDCVKHERRLDLAKLAAKCETE